MIILKTPEEIKEMQLAGAITASVFDAVAPHIRPGVSTLQLDHIARDTIVRQGAKPSFFHYGEPPYPGNACVSINDEVVHGIPREDRILEDGDIVSVDVGAYIHGFHGDAARTFLCGTVSPEWQKLVEVTEMSFWKGLEQAHVGNRLGDIGHAVQAYAESFGYGVVRDLTGHGIGHEMHEDPDVLNYGKAGHGLRLAEGMVLALEPMITEGSYHIEVLDDDWTCVTEDGKAASHYENSFAITANGPLLLTCPEHQRPDYARNFAWLAH